MTTEMDDHIREVLDRGATELKANGFEVMRGTGSLEVYESKSGRMAVVPWLWLEVADEGYLTEAVTRWLDAYARPRASISDMAKALDRYGRHEKGCGMLRSVRTMSECTCGLHKWIREGGVKP